MTIINVLLFVHLAISDDQRSNLANIKSLNDDPGDEYIIRIPPFSEWNNNNKNAQISEDGKIVTVKGGTQASESIRVSVKLSNIPEGIEYTHFRNDCRGPPGQSAPSALCYIDLALKSETVNTSVWGQNSYLYKTTEYDLLDTPLKETSFILYLENRGDIPVQFTMPQISVRNYKFQKADYKVDKNGKVTVSIKKDSEYQLSTLQLVNAFQPPRRNIYSKDPAIFPILANATHIVGIDIEDDRFFIPWDYQVSTDTFFKMSLHAREDFDITFYVIETSSVNILDALEQWHDKFAHIYHKQDFGTGNWVPFEYNQRDDLDTTYLANFFWASGEKYKSKPLFRYVEPTCAHVPNITFSEDPNIMMNTLKECAEDTADTKRSNACKRIIEYGVRGPDGFLANIRYENAPWNENGVICKIDMEDEPYHDYFDGVVSAIQKDREKYTGIALDSFAAIDRSYAIADRIPFSDNPFYLVDDKGGYLLSLTGMYSAIRKNSESIPGCVYMANANAIFPQFVKYVVMSGYECNFNRDSWFNKYSNINFFNLRYSMGSRALSMLENSIRSESLQYYESYFSACAMLGIYPSYFSHDASNDNFWTNEKDLEYVKNAYQRWGPILNEALNGTKYRANRLGRVNFTVNSDNDEVSESDVQMFCKDNDQTCYLFALLAGSGKVDKPAITMDIEFIGDKFSEANAIFTAKDLQCKVNNNKAHLEISGLAARDSVRTACIRLDYSGSSAKTGLSGGAIFGIILSVIIVGGVCAFFIWWYITKRPKDVNDAIHQSLNV